MQKHVSLPYNFILENLGSAEKHLHMELFLNNTMSKVLCNQHTYTNFIISEQEGYSRVCV